MAYDAAAFSPRSLTVTAPPAALLIDAAAAPCPEWAARNPERALALLFVAPQDCDAVDVLASL